MVKWVEVENKTVKAWAGALITLVILLYILSVIRAELSPAMDDIRLALTLVMFVWILNWMRNLLGSPRLALLFALVISYLIFFKHPNLLLTVFGLMALAYFIKPLYSKATDTGAPPHVDIMNFYKDMAEKSGGMWLTIAPPGAWPFYYPPTMVPMKTGGTQSQQQGGNQGGGGG